MFLLFFNFHVGIKILNKNGLRLHKAQPVSSCSGGFLLHNTHMARIFRSPTQYYFAEYEHELCIQTIKINTKKRTIYF